MRLSLYFILNLMVRFCNSMKTNHKTNELQLNQKTINKEFIERVFSLAVDLN